MGSIASRSFPSPPKQGLDWGSLAAAGLGDGSIGHVESRFSVQTGEWSEPELVADPYIKIHGLSPGINYGQQVYEGLKGFRTANGDITVFRPKRHAGRLNHSAAHVSIPAVSEEHFLKCVNLAVARNSAFVPPSESESLLYIRPVIVASAGQIALQPSSEYLLCVYVLPGSAYHGVGAQVAVVMEDFDRAAPKGTGAAKVGGNYAPVIRWSNAARKEGYTMTLHLDSKTQTFIEEFSTSAFLGIKEEADRVTVVVPDSQSIIDSITSDSITELAKQQGWCVERRPIRFEELGSFAEVAAAGTAAALVPIKSITRKSTNETFTFQGGADKMGPRFLSLFKALDNVQRGRAEDVLGWNWTVTEA